MSGYIGGHGYLPGISSAGGSGATTLVITSEDGSIEQISESYNPNTETITTDIVSNFAISTAIQGIAYVSANGNNPTAEINNPQKCFSKIQNAANAILTNNANTIIVGPDTNRYDNLVLDQFNTKQIIGTGNQTRGRNLTLTDKDGTLGYSSFINIGFLALDITNFNGTTSMLKFNNCNFNTGVTIDNDPGATSGIFRGNTYIDCLFGTPITYFPIGYAQQTNDITDYYMGCDFGDGTPCTMILNGAHQFINLVGCKNIPNFVYQNGATSDQVTIYTLSQQDIQRQSFTYGQDAGVVNSYYINPSPAVNTLVEGMCFQVHIANTNTTTDPTLTVGSSGAQLIKLANGNALSVGDLQAGQEAIFIYDGSVFQLLTPATLQWGSITGTLSNQTDLQDALDAKQNLVASPTANNLMSMDSSGQSIDSGVSLTTSPDAISSFKVMVASAVQTAIANALTSVFTLIGGYDASVNLFPSSGGSGPGSTIQKGDVWVATEPGTLGGTEIDKGATILALDDNPGQDASLWTLNANGVVKFNGREGVVFPASGDYSYSMIIGLPSTANLGKLMRGTGTAYAETTATYPDTISANQILYGSATDVISPLATQNSSALTTSEYGAVRWTNLGLGQVLMGTFTDGVVAGNVAAGTGLNGTVSTSSITINLTVPVIPTNGGTGLNSYVTGDIIYASALNTLNKLAIGTTGQVFTVTAGGVPGWQDTTVSLSSTGNLMLSTVNGVGAVGIIINTAFLSSSANLMNVFVNGVFGTAVNIINSVTLSSSTNSMTSIVNGVASGAANIINSNSLSSSTNTLTSTINGVASSGVNIVNSISLGLSGNALTATVNGVSSSSVNVQPANAPVTVSASTQALVANTTYYITYSGLCTMSLPTIAALGAIIKIRAEGASSTFKITQAAGQSISYGAQNGVAVTTTTGTGGYLQSSDPNTTVDLECTVANTTFKVVGSVNSLTVA